MSEPVSSLSVTEYPRATSVTLIGDSHVLAFSDRIFAAESGEMFAFRSFYLADVPARAYADAAGIPDPRILAALETARVLVRVGSDYEANWLSQERTAAWVRALDDRAGVEPTIVFSAGTLDLIDVSLAITTRDFELPDALRNHPDTSPSCRETEPGSMSAHEAMPLFRPPLEPLRAVLRYLRARGITRLGVMGSPAAAGTDEEFLRVAEAMGMPVPDGHERLTFRFKLALALNQTLRTMCAEEHVVYVDRWSATTLHGEQLPGIRRDIIHVSPDAAVATAADIIAIFGAKAREQARVGAAKDGEFVLAGEERLSDPRLTAIQALAEVKPGMRVLEIGGGSGRAGAVFAADGATVTALDAPADLQRDAGMQTGATRYDVAIAYDVPELYPAADVAQLYASVAALLEPDGTFIVCAAPDRQRHREDVRPPALFRRLRSAFAHVVAWDTSESPVPGEQATPDAVFAVASHRPLDRAELLSRTHAPAPLPDHGVAVALRDAVVPDLVRTGAPFGAVVTLENGSPHRLASAGPTPVLFASMWYTGAGLASDARGRSRLAVSAEPGSTRRYGIRVTAPDEPGEYGLRITLIQEHVRWFDATLDVRVTVV